MGNNNSNPNQPPNPNNPNQSSGGFLSSFWKSKPVQEENDEWDQFINQQNPRKNMIYSNCNQTLSGFDPNKTAESMKIVEKKYTKTKFHFWLKNESLNCTYNLEGNFVKIKLNLEIECKDSESFKTFPAVLSLFLFAREAVEHETGKFKGIIHGKYYGAFAHLNHDKITDSQNIEGIFFLIVII